MPAENETTEIEQRNETNKNTNELTNNKKKKNENLTVIWTLRPIRTFADYDVSSWYKCGPFAENFRWHQAIRMTLDVRVWYDRLPVVRRGLTILKFLFYSEQKPWTIISVIRDPFFRLYGIKRN